MGKGRASNGDKTGLHGDNEAFSGDLDFGFLSVCLFPLLVLRFLLAFLLAFIGSFCFYYYPFCLFPNAYRILHLALYYKPQKVAIMQRPHPYLSSHL